MKKCPKCGAKLQKGRRRCPECGEFVPQDAHFRANCGYDFFDSSSGASKSGGGLFSDGKIFLVLMRPFPKRLVRNFDLFQLESVSKLNMLLGKNIKLAKLISPKNRKVKYQGLELCV